MRIQPRTTLQSLFAALTAAALVGCGAMGGSGAPATLVPVKGKVTYKGQPLSRGRIRFTPDDGFGRPAFATLKSDGTYALTTEKEGDGVVAGHHRVTLQDTGIKSPRDTIAKKLASPAGSGLTADVDAEHSEHNFDVK